MEDAQLTMTQPLPHHTTAPPTRPAAGPDDPAQPVEIGPGTVLRDRYRIEARAGDGGSATVYRATDTVLQRRVAVKVFRPDASDGALPERRRREMRLAAAVNSPNLVAVYDAHPGTTHGAASSPADLCYLVTEYVDGPTLSDTIAAGPLDPADVRRIGQGVAAALAALHTHGLVHRDIKPGNVLFSRPEPVKLADLGIAREVDGEPLTRDDAVPGTAPYMSPEQALGRTVGPPSDIYSLGLVLLECLTGRREFPGAPMEAALARILRDPVIPADLPAPWPDLIRSMTDEDPERRPTADQVIERLDDRPRPDPRERTERPPESGRRRRWLAWAVAAVVATAGLIGSFAVLRDPDPPSPPAQPSVGTDVGQTPTAPSPDPTVNVPQPAGPPTSIQSSAADQPSDGTSGATPTAQTDPPAGTAPAGPGVTVDEPAPNSDISADPLGNGNGGNGNGNGNGNGSGNGNGNGNPGNGGEKNRNNG